MSKTDGEQTAIEEGAEPNAQPSQSQVDSSTSEGIADGEPSSLGDDFAATVKGLAKQVAEIQKKQQSTKDKAIANQDKVIKQLQESVVNLTKIVGETTSAPASRQGNEEQGSALSEVQEMFVLAGVAEDVQTLENSPEYLKFFAANKGKVDTAKALAFLRSRKQGQQAVNVSAGAIAQPPGGSAQQSSDEQNQIEYVKEMNANRGNVTAIRDVQSKFRKLGVPVEQIGFN